MRYNKTTIRAIEKSIRHWERMRDNKRIKMVDEDGYKCLESPYSENCQLCRLFINRGHGCEGCPIMDYTGFPDCNDSPYRDARDDYARVYRDGIKSNGDMNQEVQFLQKVLSWAKGDV